MSIQPLLISAFGAELLWGAPWIAVLVVVGLTLWVFLRRQPHVSGAVVPAQRTAAHLSAPRGALARPESSTVVRKVQLARVSDPPADEESYGGAGLAAVVREARLELKNEELTIILDALPEGFASARLDGTLRSERSAVLSKWAGELPERAHYWDLIERLEPGRGSWAKMAWEQVTEGFLPLDAALEQLPLRLHRAGQHFQVAYHPVIRGTALQRVVVVVTDITADVERQRAAQGQQEFSQLVERLMRDRGAFLDFWKEAEMLMRRVLDERTQDSVQLKRDLHTLKGNLRFFGVFGLAQICHGLEDVLAESGKDQLSTSDAEPLRAEWNALHARVEPLIAGSENSIEVPETEYARLLQASQAGAPHTEIVQALVDLKMQPVRWRLDWAKQHVQRVAQTLGKTTPEVLIEDDGLRLPRGNLSAFWSAFVHLLNNVADHGIETDERREERGKPLPAQLRLAARREGTELVFEVSDDGPGIDWDRLAERSGGLAGAPMDAAARDRLLFTDGVSQRDQVTSISGRGAGLAAFRSTVVSLNGRIEVFSEVGEGTRFSVRLPFEEPTRGARAKVSAGQRA